MVCSGEYVHNNKYNACDNISVFTTGTLPMTVSERFFYAFAVADIFLITFSTFMATIVFLSV